MGYVALQIVGPYKNLARPRNFLHDYAHAVQLRGGLYPKYQYQELIGDFFNEAHGYAYSNLCSSRKKDKNPMWHSHLMKKYLQEVWREIAQKTITLQLFETTDEQERFVMGLAQDRAIGAMMEMYMSTPNNISNIFKKQGICNADQIENSQAEIDRFQKDYEASKVFASMKRVPYVAHQYVEIYSQIHGYEIKMQIPKMYCVERSFMD